MIRLGSRNYPGPEDFLQDFFETLTPGIIPRTDFINWKGITEKMAQLIPSVEFYSEVKARGLEDDHWVRELADSLLACDNVFSHIRCAFEMLGHTNAEFVTSQDDLQIMGIAEAIEANYESKALDFSILLRDLGFHHVLLRDDLEDLLCGIQIGLETHRRKNIGGEYFRHCVAELLANTVRNITTHTGFPLKLLEEKVITYGEGLSKRVDFAIMMGDRCRFGIEVNFYTVAGSKPTEIKRSYGNILLGLEQVGVDLIWITDGKGYQQMHKSLRDAYILFPNIYNRSQADRHLADDLAAVLQAEHK